MSTLILSHGDKGGVGKSTVAITIASRLYEQGAHIGIIEADATGGKSNVGGMPDVGPRFASRINQIATLPLQDTGRDAEQSVARMIQVIEHWDCDYIIMNTPANASTTLEQDNIGSMMAALLGEIGINIRVTYSLFPSQRSTVTAGKAASGHIMSAASHAALILNEYLGDTPAFESQLQQSGVLKGLPRVQLARMSPDIAQLIVDNGDENLAELTAKDGPLDMTSRFRLNRWYRESADALLSGIGIDLNDHQEVAHEQR